MVDATILIMTVPAPLTAASGKSRPWSVARKQLSMTTMELSTIIPIAITRAPMVIIFRSNPRRYMITSVAKTERGMELPTIRDARRSPKKISRTSMAKTTPRASVSPTDFRALVISLPESYIMSKVTPASCFSILSRALRTLDATLTVDALWTLYTRMVTFSAPL